MAHWRSDPMMAFVPQSWQAPKRITPQWLATRPLIFNDATTHMYRLTMAWFANAGFTPRARIELNFTEAMKSLVAAGYGAAVLPLEQTGQPAIQHGIQHGVQVIPLRPALARHTAVVHRPAATVDGATRKLLQMLMQFRQAGIRAIYPSFFTASTASLPFAAHGQHQFGFELLGLGKPQIGQYIATAALKCDALRRGGCSSG